MCKKKRPTASSSPPGTTRRGHRTRRIIDGLLDGVDSLDALNLPQKPLLLAVPQTDGVRRRLQRLHQEPSPKSGGRLAVVARWLGDPIVGILDLLAIVGSAEGFGAQVEGHAAAEVVDEFLDKVDGFDDASGLAA